MSEKNSPSSANKKKNRKSGEGTVYWDSRIKKYTAEVFDIHGKRQKARFDDETSAHNWRSAQREAREKGEGTYVRNPKSTLSEYLTDWLKTKFDLSPNGYRFYEETIKHRINPYIGNVRLANLNTKILETFLKTLVISHNYKGGTVDGVVRTLNAALNDGVTWGELPYNPLKRAKKPKIKSIPSLQIPEDDARRLRVEAAKNPYDHARLEIGIAVGLRPGEVAGLKWSDFDAAKKNLKIVRQLQRVKGKGLVESPPKTLRKHPIPLIDDEVLALVSLKKYYFRKTGKLVSGDDYIFTNSFGTGLDSTTDRKWFRNLCARAGVERYQRYQMRKTAFTELSRVTDLGTLKAFSGHSQIKTLIDHYITPSESQIRISLDKRRQMRDSNTSTG